MQTVTVVFKNGAIAHFSAEEFDANFGEALDYVNKYPYKDARGNESAIYLKPDVVAGVFLTQPPPGETRSISTSSPGS
jgi:hypothetical protein